MTAASGQGVCVCGGGGLGADKNQDRIQMGAGLIESFLSSLASTCPPPDSLNHTHTLLTLPDRGLCLIGLLIISSMHTHDPKKDPSITFHEHKNTLPILHLCTFISPLGRSKNNHPGFLLVCYCFQVKG